MNNYQILDDPLEMSLLVSQIIDIEAAFKNSEQQHHLSWWDQKKKRPFEHYHRIYIIRHCIPSSGKLQPE